MIACLHCPCLFACAKRQLMLLHHVDDFFLGFPKASAQHAAKLWAALRAEITTDEPSPIEEILGCRITRDRKLKTMHISQTKAIRALMIKLEFERCNKADTPMAPNFVPSIKDCPTEKNPELLLKQTHYRSALMSLVYFARWTMPQITYTISKLGKFLANPGEIHFQALRRLLRYVFHHADTGLNYPAQATEKTGIYCYWDSSFADDVDTRRSTMGHVFYYAGCPISWNSKLHSYVTTSTNHSEYCGLAKAAREAKFFNSIMTYLGKPETVTPISLFGDNSGAIAQSHNPENQAKTKHVDISDHYSRELQEVGIIATSVISTHENVADILTKALAGAKFIKHTSSLTGKC